MRIIFGLIATARSEAQTRSKVQNHWSLRRAWRKERK
ncbi:hypothetical protein V6Z11_D03G069500 [Gossypium hirsutum]